jgi:predicted Zn-dependent protease
VATREGEVELSLAVYEGGAGAAYHFMMVSSPGKGSAAALGALFGSFRLLSEEQVRALKPREIRVVRTGDGDSLQTMARRMASDHPLDHFLMLNGRSPDQPLRTASSLRSLR